MIEERKKIIGVMTVWGAEQFIEPCIEQSLYLCDEVIVLVGFHNDKMEKWADKTLEICEKYKDKITLVEAPECRNETYTTWRPRALNTLLKNSKLFKNGNWVFLIDVDEFLLKSSMDLIKEKVQEDDYDIMWIDDLFFFFNMTYYTDGCGNYRLWKIQDEKTDGFASTNEWINANHSANFINSPTTFRLGGKYSTFHFSMLCSHDQKITYWETEYNHNQGEKIEWISQKYIKSNLNDENYLREIIRTSPARGGEMKKYEGDFPEYIKKHNLHKVEDFRELYK